MIFKDLLESRKRKGENMAFIVILSGRILYLTRMTVMAKAQQGDMMNSKHRGDSGI